MKRLSPKTVAMKNRLPEPWTLRPLLSNGVEQKAKITVNFLKRKMNEYEKITQEIEELKGEVGGSVNN